MKKANSLPLVVAFLCAGLLNLHAGTNTWGALMYTRYQASKVYHAPLTRSAVRRTLAANEVVKVDFKSGGWYAVFRPSEAVRSITNAVGYMETQDLFPAPLPVGTIEGGVGTAPPLARTIEEMEPIPQRRQATHSPTSAAQSPHPAGDSTQRKKPELTSATKVAIENYARNDARVVDAGMSRSGTTISMVIVVRGGTSENEAKQLGEAFVQQANAQLGKGNFDFMIEVTTDASGNHRRLAFGAQARVANHVTW